MAFPAKAMLSRHLLCYFYKRLLLMITRMTLSGPNVLIPSRKRIAAQLIMENDEFLMRGEPSLFVKSIRRNEDRGTVKVSFQSGETRTFDWGQKI